MPSPAQHRLPPQALDSMSNRKEEVTISPPLCLLPNSCADPPQLWHNLWAGEEQSLLSLQLQHRRHEVGIGAASPAQGWMGKGCGGGDNHYLGWSVTDLAEKPPTVLLSAWVYSYRDLENLWRIWRFYQSSKTGFSFICWTPKFIPLTFQCIPKSECLSHSWGSINCSGVLVSDLPSVLHGHAWVKSHPRCALSALDGQPHRQPCKGLCECSNSLSVWGLQGF